MPNLPGLLKEAFRATKAAKSRTLLSALCIGLGIAGITIIAALGSAAIQKTNEIMDLYGSDSLIVVSGNPKSKIGSKSITITLKDMDGIKANFPDAYVVVPFRWAPDVMASYESAKLTVELSNSVTSLTEEWGWPVYKGRDLNAEDNSQHRNVCAIGWYTDQNLFPNTNAIGQQIRLGRSSCEVVGVYVKKNFGGDDADSNNFVNLPDSVYKSKYVWRKDIIFGMRLRFINAGGMDNYEQQINSFLRYQHNLKDSDEDDFQIFSSKSISRMIFAVIGAIGAFLLVITMVVIVVGGFVTANMFLLATQTRINEIGIRRAFGATENDIFIQFIFEFILTAFCGMIIGLAVAWPVTLFVSSFDFLEVKITPAVFGLTAFSSLVVALIFGTIPAKKASKTSPIEAIRTL